MTTNVLTLARDVDTDDVTRWGWDALEANLIRRGQLVAELQNVQLAHPIPNATKRKVVGRTWWGKPTRWVLHMHWHVIGGPLIDHINAND